MYGVVTCNIANPARSTIIAWDTEENFGSNRRIRNWGFYEVGRGVTQTSIPKSHVARTVLQCHAQIQLGAERDSGNWDHWEVGGRSEELSEGTWKLCEIKGARRQRQCSRLGYSWVECAEWEVTAQQRDVEVRQVGRETDKQAKHWDRRFETT
jgi:hypothetical protein